MHPFLIYKAKKLLFFLGQLIVWLILLFLLTRPAAAATIPKLTDHTAILAILGEAENQPFIGQVAVGEVIRRRGSLKGVYGVLAPRIKAGAYSDKAYRTAAHAWAVSASTNHSQNALGWGNEHDLKIFRRQSWFQSCHIVVKIQDHYFWGR